MPDITKINRAQYATFIDTTPTSNSATYKIVGIGVTTFAQEFNPQTTTEKWIIHNNATTTHDGNQKQGSVSQKMYKGDPCFEYVNSLRDKFGSDVRTTILDVDLWDSTGEGSSASYKAKKSDATIIITSYGGEDAVIEYTIYYDGDPIEGSVTIADGVPTFTPTVA